MALFNAHRKRRLIGVLTIVLSAGVAVWFGITAFQENIAFFFSPTEVAEGSAPTNHPFRMGGLVVPGSVEREEDGVTVRFELSDLVNSVAVRYQGILPDLFREEQGIVVQGSLDEDGTFRAREVLAKHDENYMPPEISEMLERNR
ncbi:MAG: cytochrome c maturation protein CcmE [Aquisalimonadaceae bacterium]